MYTGRFLENRRFLNFIFSGRYIDTDQIKAISVY